MYTRADLCTGRKPENVLLDTEGHCRLVDFGLPHVRRPMGQRGECRQTAGHLHIYHRSNYREKTGGYARIVDWWAFGCVAC